MLFSTEAYFKDYYWRDFFGSVPSDAVEGGYSEINGSTYIGQALNIDVSPVEIHEGRPEVYVPVEFPKPQKDLVKVSRKHLVNNGILYHMSGKTLVKKYFNIC